MSAGDIREGDKLYSGDVRQQLVSLSQLHSWNASEMRINPPDKAEYDTELAAATFCLAPYGYGWGIRLIQVLQVCYHEPLPDAVAAFVA